MLITFVLAAAVQRVIKFRYGWIGGFFFGKFYKRFYRGHISAFGACEQPPGYLHTSADLLVLFNKGTVQKLFQALPYIFPFRHITSPFRNYANTIKAKSRPHFFQRFSQTKKRLIKRSIENKD